MLEPQENMKLHGYKPMKAEVIHDTTRPSRASKAHPIKHLRVEKMLKGTFVRMRQDIQPNKLHRQPKTSQGTCTDLAAKAQKNDMRIPEII